MLDELQRLSLYQDSNPNELSKQQFLKIRNEIQHPDLNTISDEYFDFMLWSKGLPSRQERFANFIAKKLANHKGSKILEVGGGRTGRLSRMMNEKGFIMTCIDPKLEMTNNGNIEFIKGIFHYKNFDITKFDYVIAQEPCEATEHVVRGCIAQQKPFMMSLCGVPHKLISGEMPNSVQEWYNYLLSISFNEMKLRYVCLDPFVSIPILRSNQF